MQGLDIAIAGCGPCGLAAALLLDRAGYHVSLFERFSEPQPIGSGLMLQPTGMAVLSQMNLLDEITAMGSRIDRIFGKASGRIILDVGYDVLGNAEYFGIGIHRASLFSVLYQAVIHANISIETHCTIVGSDQIGPKRALCFADGAQSRPYDLVIDALGTRTALAPPTGRDLAYGALWAGLDWPEDAGFNPHMLEQRYYRSSKMVGVLPIGTQSGSGRKQAAFFWSIRADQVENWRAKGLEHWKADVRHLWPNCSALLDQITDMEQLTFASYAHRTLPVPAEKALIHIGDAWHSASPQLGQGANMALLDAWALAKGLEHADTVDKAIDRAIKMRRRHIVLYQLLTAMFTPVYQSDSRILPFIRDRLMGPISKIWPATTIQAMLVSGLVGNPFGALELPPASKILS